MLMEKVENLNVPGLGSVCARGGINGIVHGVSVFQHVEMTALRGKGAVPLVPSFLPVPMKALHGF